jgi:hypothetical protein
MTERSLQAQWLIPIAISLAFGVLFALLVTLFFVPALYGIGADIRRFFIYLFTGQPQPKFTSQSSQAKVHKPKFISQKV